MKSKEHSRARSKTQESFQGKTFQNRPSHLCKLQLSVKTFVPRQGFPFHFGAGLEQVRVRVLCPPPQGTLHGCHDDH